MRGSTYMARVLLYLPPTRPLVPLSLSLCQELAEASEAYHATAAELQEVKAKLDATSREMRRTGLTKDEVAGLPPEVCCKESPAQRACSLSRSVLSSRSLKPRFPYKHFHF